MFDEINPLLMLLMAITVPACAGLAYSIVLLVRVARSVRAAPLVADGLKLPAPQGDDWPMLSIIVPAHNEQDIIDRCAESLRNQDYPRLEIFFVMDRCTDATASRLAGHALADPRIKVIDNRFCPEDWAGKCNAARCGAENATGEYLLFTDADTRFDPRLCRAAVALALHRSLDLLSILSTLTARRRFERIVQPVATMRLLSMYPIERVNRPRDPRPFANGQFLLFRREFYDRIGGHAAVKDDLLEDIAFARRVFLAGGCGGIVRSGGMLRVRMYESFREFRDGWKRIYIEAAKRKPARLRQSARRLLLGGILLPLFQIAAAVVAIVALIRGEVISYVPLGLLILIGISMLVQYSALAWVYALANAPKRGVAFYWLGCWHVVRILRAAARDLKRGRPIRWGGREYVLQPR